MSHTRACAFSRFNSRQEEITLKQAVDFVRIRIEVLRFPFQEYIVFMTQKDQKGSMITDTFTINLGHCGCVHVFDFCHDWTKHLQ